MDLRTYILPLIVFSSLGAGLAEVSAEEPVVAFSAESINFFEMEIRPVLAESCYECHQGEKARNGLELDHRAGIISGTDYHPVVNLENPGASRLLTAIKHSDPKGVKPMPDKGDKLSDEAIAAFEKWIGMGLPWPDEALPAGAGESKSPKEHWSYQPIQKPTIPENYQGNPIDYFIDQKLAEKELDPAARATRATLYRRAHIDLLGLPPKYEDLKAFLDDPRPENEVWASLIDSLLESPHYGERQARHWMDIARYSDTKGYLAGGKERRFVYGYSYRDWLIRSFNEDMSWDQFLLYQLAADRLVDRENPEELPHLAALGFITLSKVGRREEVVDDRIDTTFRGMMGLTVACARCHDHKFDPIPTAEYYSIYGIFNNSIDAKEAVKIGEPKGGPEYEAYLKELAKKQKVVDDYVESAVAKLRTQYPDLKTTEQLFNKATRDVRRERTNKQTVVDKFVADSGMEPPRALVVEDRENRAGQQIYIRGDTSRRGDKVEPRFLSLASHEPLPAFTADETPLKGSGRLEMAEAIIDPSNTLTARVAVNRIWQQHFGEGIVRTLSDFGIQGDTPSHAELLDWLATWFVDQEWSVKKLHRLIMTSKVYQREVEHPAATGYAEVDPENRLLWHFNRQRVDFETMRDAMLEVAENLDRTMFGRSVEITSEPFTNRRSLYAFIDRQNLPPVFRTFDFANPQETTGQRSSTTIPTQALYALNGEFVIEQARKLAKSVDAIEPGEKVAGLYRKVFARDPQPAEIELGLQFLESDVQLRDARPNKQTNGDWQYGYGIFDQETRQTRMTLLSHWNGERWQVREEWPVKDNPLSYLFASPVNIHSGSNAEHSWIGRWMAPRDLRVKILSVLRRSNVGKGNGVIGQVIIPDDGAQTVGKELVLEPSQDSRRVDLPEVEIKAGQTIDFIVDPREDNASHDTVNWVITLQNLDNPDEIWNYKNGFSGPADPLEPLAAYAQALLMTNEFQFID